MTTQRAAFGPLFLFLNTIRSALFRPLHLFSRHMKPPNSFHQPYFRVRYRYSANQDGHIGGILQVQGNHYSGIEKDISGIYMCAAISAWARLSSYAGGLFPDPPGPVSNQCLHRYMMQNLCGLFLSATPFSLICSFGFPVYFVPLYAMPAIRAFIRYLTYFLFS